MQESTTGLGLGVTPIGPTWDLRHYFLGADDQGRDVAARLLYGGRNSLLIGVVRGAHHVLRRDDLGLVAGFFGGLVDGVLSRLLDVVWAFPVYLLAISLSTVLIARGFSLGPFHLESGQPAAADRDHRRRLRPVRRAADPRRGAVAAPARVRRGGDRARRVDLAALWSDILRNVVTTVIVFFPLMVAIDMLTEAALSFLSIGVQPPDASWGTIILDGQGLLYTRPAVAIAPGIAIALTVLALNVLGDGVRDALDPRAKLRRGRLMLRFVARRLVSMVFVLFSISVLDVPHLLRDARASTRRRASPAGTPTRRRCAACATTSGSTGRCPSSTR